MASECPLCGGHDVHVLDKKERKQFVRHDEDEEGMEKAWKEHKYERGDRINPLTKCENCGAVTED